MRPTLLYHYCKSDLFSSQVRYTTIFLLLILIFASMIGAICGGLPKYYEYIRTHELEQRHGALTLHFVAPPFVSFSDDQFETLKKAFEPLKKNNAITEIFPNIQFSVDCDIAKSNLVLKIKGRMIEDNDVSLIGEVLKSGEKIKNIDYLLPASATSSDSSQTIPVIIDKKFRSVLKQKGDGPFSCNFSKDSTIFNLKVVAELEHEQEDECYFYVRKSSMDLIRAKAVANSIKSNSIDVLGLNKNAVNKREFKDWCKTNNYRSPYESISVDGKSVIRLSLSNNQSYQSNSNWAECLVKIEKIFELPKNSLSIVNYTGKTTTNYELKNYGSISGMFVNVRQIKNLRNVEKIFLEWRESQAGVDGRDNGIYMGLPKLENPVMIRLVEEVDESTKNSKTIVFLCLCGLLGVLVLCFGTMIYTRIEQKKSEIGLLRMMGGSRFTIQGITILQTFILGFFGIMIGLFIGIFVFSLYLYLNNMPFSTVFNNEFVIYLLVSALGCLISMVLASIVACYMASIQSPSQLINSH
jgi:ABC-type antimicrobial peptide transport system permease subunit